MWQVGTRFSPQNILYNLVFCGAFDTLATRIVTGGGDRAAKVWDLSSNKGPVAT